MGSLIQGGMNAFGAVVSAEGQQAWTAAEHTIDDANTYAANTVNEQQVKSSNAVRLANNALQAAQAASANTKRSLGNQLRLQKLGQQSDTLNQNIARVADKTLRGTVDQRIQASEQMGALMAQVSNSGTGGGSSAQIISSLAIQQARQRQALKDSSDAQSYDAKMQQAGLQGNRFLALDLNQTIANINTAQDVFIPTQSPIVAGDFAPDPIEQGWRAFFGNTNWAQAAQQGSAMLNGASASRSGAYSTGSYGSTGNYSSSAVGSGPNYAPSSWTSNNASSDMTGTTNVYGFSNSGSKPDYNFDIGSTSSEFDAKEDYSFLF